MTFVNGVSLQNELDAGAILVTLEGSRLSSHQVHDVSQTTVLERTGRVLIIYIYFKKILISNLDEFEDLSHTAR